MPNHLHLLMAPAQADVIAFENAWKSWTTTKSWKLGNMNALWQPGMWDRTIRSPEDFDEVAAYIVRNPVAAGFVDSDEEWEHSWAWWWEV
jgi:REP element-mobilizing transposase RayT